MIVRIASGIPGFDDFTSSDDDLGLDLGGIPENTATLIYGPQGVGKSIFAYAFAYHGLTQDEPCLYLTTDLEMGDLYQKMAFIGLKLDEYSENEMFYVVDAALSDSGSEMEDSDLYQSTSVKNPTDILVKVSRGARMISNKGPRFRSVIDSLTTILESNNPVLIVRVLKTYILRVKEAGGTAIIIYTEGSTNSSTEILIKSMVDNIIKLDQGKITIEAMKGMGRKDIPYQITEKGIVLDNSE